ncbi:MAG: hypothetical protein ACP6IP_01855 [Candidatus Njordarchaeia archaeon]
MPSEEKLRGVLTNRSILAKKKTNPYWRVYYSSGFGEETEEALILDLIEAAFLFEQRKIVIVTDKNQIVTKEDLFKLGAQDENFWLKFTIYQDLRTRGYPVKLSEDYPIIINVYPRGTKPVNTKPVYSIMGAEAAKEVKLGTLDKAVKICRKLGTKLLVGLVDELGEVTYYSVREVLEEEEIENVNEMFSEEK